MAGPFDYDCAGVAGKWRRSKAVWKERGATILWAAFVHYFHLLPTDILQGDL